MSTVRSHWLLICLTGLLLAGCGGLKLDPAPIRDVALSGVWELDFAESDNARSAMKPDARRGDKRMSTRAEIQRIRAGSGLAFVAYDFQVLDARRMDIELASDSMGIQHFPGVYRDISWGMKERGVWQVQAGWDENALVIASRTTGITVLERYQLTTRDRLLVSLDIKADGNSRVVNRYFRRGR